MCEQKVVDDDGDDDGELKQYCIFGSFTINTIQVLSQLLVCYSFKEDHYLYQ